MRISDWSSDVCTADLRHIAKAEFEQLIAAPRLAIIVAIRGRPAQYLDLAIVEPEAFVDARNLRFGGAFIGQENACRAALDDRRRDERAFYVGKALRGDDLACILLAACFEPLALLCRVGADR